MRCNDWTFRLVWVKIPQMVQNKIRCFLVAGVFAVSLTVNAQQWHSTNSIPLYRGTAIQSLAITNMQQSSACAGNLRQLGVAASLWGNDHSSNFMPTNWQQFTNNIEFARLLYCPKDTAHPQQTNWSSVNFSAISYRIVSPGASLDDPGKVFIECNVHTNRLFVSSVTKEATIFDQAVPLIYDGALRTFLPPLNEAKKRSFKVSCINNLKQVGIASISYFNDHGSFPTSFAQITNDLGVPDVLYCPAERTNVIPGSFAQVNYSNVSYKILAPGALGDIPELKYVECRTHGNYLTVDGAVTGGLNNLKRLIVGDPFSQTAEPGGRVDLAVMVNTNADQLPFQYQWRKQQPFDNQGRPFTNTVIISGATNRTLVFTNVQASQEGYYDVVVRDAKGGYEESFMAYLRVEPLSNIKNAFAWENLSCVNNLKNIGLAARLRISDLGVSIYPSNFYYYQNELGWPLSLYCPGDLSRQPQNLWNFVNFNDTSYTLYTNVSEENPSEVLARCKIHNYQVLSDGSVPNLVTFPAITQQPLSVTVPPGGTANFSVTATGTNLVYQWKRNGTLVATGSNLTLSNVTVSQSGEYTVVVSNSMGSVVSQPASLTVGLWLLATNTPTGLVLTWPTNISCRLQYRTNVSGQGIWQDLTGIPNPYTVPPTSVGSRFYRLVSP